MRCTTLALIACLSLLGCKQPADVVGYAIAPIDTGGAGGASAADAGMTATGGVGMSSGGSSASASGGMGGMVSTGGMGETGGSQAAEDPTCDNAASIGLALLRLTAIVNNGCVFDGRDITLGALVWRYVLPLRPVSDPETVPFDVECSRTGLPARLASEDGSLVMLCPGYCEALKRRLVEQESELEGCVPDAGI